MATYVNDSGTWREINNLYVHDGTSFTNKTIDNINEINDRNININFKRNTFIKDDSPYRN